MRIQQFTNTTNIKTSLIIAAGTLAIGAVSSISAAPAGAVSFNSSNNAASKLSFGLNNSDFGTGVTGLAGNRFDVIFNTTPSGSLGNTVTSSQGAFATSSTSFTPGVTNLTSGNPTGTFVYESGTLISSKYKLDNDLVFNFTNGVTYTFLKGAVFTGSKPVSTNSISFQLDGVTNPAAFFTSGADRTDALTSIFKFDDSAAGTGGQYSITASPSNVPLTAVPEPFTVIGSIVGGAAALRMRKKMSKSVED
jgi:hypothetical protein